MIEIANAARFGLLLAAAGLAGCAGSESLLRQPSVELASVEASEMSLAGQKFLLGFDVHNPNPYPLPVSGLRYRIRLNDRSFAGGETRGKVTVPADGLGSFVIAVELDLMRSGMQVATLLRSGLTDRLDYELHGSLDLDLPGSPSVGFASSGTVAVQSELR